MTKTARRPSPVSEAERRHLERRRQQRERAEKIRAASVALNDAMLDAWNDGDLVCQPTIFVGPSIDKPLVRVEIFTRLTDANGQVK